ncbi:threonine--tRNA ligase [Candidatus Berkelbacteria bacterium]|nr:threonine--tRNA ligase [Candidatus Berkelbacteria bacterium]
MEEKEKLQNMRHSCAHLLAAAVQELWPDVKLGIGPVIENGLYYDFDLGHRITEEDFPAIEKKMAEIKAQNLVYERKEFPIAEAVQRVKAMNQPYKLELIEQIESTGSTVVTGDHQRSQPSSGAVTFYTTGKFIDLCRGGHVRNTSEIGPFKILSVAGAYWRGDEKNKMLQRIYVACFQNQVELDEHVKRLAEAREHDHRKLGKELGLFAFSKVVGKGLPLWTEKGATIRRVLERFIVDEEIRRGYKHVYTPDIANLDLYRKSGHYPYYKDSMYAPIVIDGEEYMLRPMTCPHHYELFLSASRSYRDLPMRLAEVAKLYRYEQSGELSGLIRVRSFSLADAHIICADVNQAEVEIARALDLIEYLAQVFGFKMGKDYWYRLSLGDRGDEKKYFKNDAAWDEGEKMLRQVLTTRQAEFIEAPGEAAFYGPKIDIQMRNVNGKEDTAFTVQYDFAMPARFNLVYAAPDGSEKLAVVVHRSSIGAIERIIAFLIEFYAGKFPFWLAPVQIKILPISDRHLEYADQVAETLQAYRVEVDGRPESIGKKIRTAQLEKVPYMLIVGDKELESRQVAVRARDEGDLGTQPLKAFVETIKRIDKTV